MPDPGQPERQPSAAPRVGKYELLRRIGVGGMASVYMARVRGDAGFFRIYALKVMHPHLAVDPALVDMLLDEAKIASRLSHPNVVGTVDVGRADDHYYIALDYVDGVALDRLLAKKPHHRPPSFIVPLAIDALLGLAAAHELTDEEGRSYELVHRDVTPGNVIVGVDGCGLIADFGIAKARARATKTNPGIVKGKAGYIAPEVALGRPIDARADVFSMGVLLWNALTGESLYDTNDLSKSISALLSKEVPSPSEVGLCPPAIFDLPIMMALAREPHARHASARDMADALSDALALSGGEPPRSRIGEWVETAFAPMLQKRRDAAAPEGEVEVAEPAGRGDPTVPFAAVPAEEQDDDALTTEIWDNAIKSDPFAEDPPNGASGAEDPVPDDAFKEHPIASGAVADHGAPTVMAGIPAAGPSGHDQPTVASVSWPADPPIDASLPARVPGPGARRWPWLAAGLVGLTLLIAAAVGGSWLAAKFLVAPEPAPAAFPANVVDY